MKLYYSKGACSFAVRILINELNIPCDFESVDLKSKITETNKNFLEINPKGAVPTLEIEKGHIITENAVIQEYIADTHKANKLLPPLGDIKRYEVLSKLAYVSTELHKTMGAFFMPNIPESLKKDFFLPMIKRKLQYVENVLAKQEYFAGPDFTLPDAYLYVIIMWTGFLKIDITEFKSLRKYFEKLSSRESIKKSLVQEGM